MEGELIFQILWLILIAIILIASWKKKKQIQEEILGDFFPEEKKEPKVSSQAKDTTSVKIKFQKEKDTSSLSKLDIPKKKVPSFNLNLRDIKDGFIFSVILGEPKAYKFIKRIS